MEQLGIIETVHRKVVASFTSRVQRVRVDFAVQTSNSYVFYFAVADRPAHGDLALPLFAVSHSMGNDRSAPERAATTAFVPDA